MDFAFQLFGLRVTSNRRLPGLDPIPTRGRAECASLSVCFGTGVPQEIRALHANHSELFYESLYRTESGEPAFRTWAARNESLMRIEYQDSTEFWIDLEGGKIWARWGERSSFEDAAAYLLGPVFGFLLRMRGVICLHASAVALDGRAIAFAGIPGAGKSTTAAAMVQRGWALLSDDIVAIAEHADGFHAVPGHPMVGLWPDAAEKLYGTASAGRALSGNDSKRALSLGGDQFASEAVPLAGIFLLEERSAEPAALRVERMPQQQALISLVANTYANLLLNAELREREFAFLGRLVNSVPVKRLRPDKDIARVGALCELIEKEIGSASTGARMAAER